MPNVEFGRLDDARQIREDRRYAPFLAEVDDGRKSTVRLRDGTPKEAVEFIRGEAAESRQHEREQAGQVELTRTERREIDFSNPNVNVLKARSIKGIAANEGVDDWTAFADLELSVDENRAVLKDAKRDELGGRMDATTNESHQIDRAARAHQKVKTQSGPHARKFAFQGDEGARDQLRSEGLGESLDIHFSRDGGRLRGEGEDFERLLDTHESRSQRAQTLDEKKTAPVTRDAFVWQDNPEKWDYPGIDTVDPEKLHESRSQRAQTIDEREIAPIAETKEQWAMNPDRYDWKGVDAPASYGATRDTPIPQGAFGNAPGGGGLSESFESLGEDDDYLFSSGGRRLVDEDRSRKQDQDLFGEMVDLGNDDPLGFVDDRDRQGSLSGFGLEVTGTERRESRLDVEKASVFGVDDRSSASRGSSKNSKKSTQKGLGGFGGDLLDEDEAWF